MIVAWSLLAACTEIVSGLGFAAGLLTPLTAAGCVGIMVVAAILAGTSGPQGAEASNALPTSHGRPSFLASP